MRGLTAARASEPVAARSSVPLKARTAEPRAARITLAHIAREIVPSATLALLLAAAPSTAAAAEPWAPQSALFQINFRWASITLLVAAAGIALGLFGGALYRRRQAGVRPGSREIERHSLGHRLSHWLNAIGFLLAMGTGALLTVSWIPNPFALPLLYTLHYFGAAAILLGLGGTAVHALTTGASRRHRLLPDGETLRTAGIELLAYAGLVGDRGILGFSGLQWPAEWRRGMERAVGFQGFPAEGKYLATQRLLSYPLWVLVSLAVVATGLLKALRYAYPLPGSVVFWATRIHDWAFIGTIVMLFVHVAAVVLVRTNWPLLRSMFTGKVSLAYVQAIHGRWYQELLRESAGRTGSAAAPHPSPRPSPGGGGAPQ